MLDLLICGILGCQRVEAPKPPQPPQPARVQQEECILIDQCPDGRPIQNQPDVCSNLNSAYSMTEQQEKYWRDFKCPLG